jgi:hypothetical protein
LPPPRMVSISACRLASVRFCAAASSRRSLRVFRAKRRVSTTILMPSFINSRICLSCWSRRCVTVIPRDYHARKTTLETWWGGPPGPRGTPSSRWRHNDVSILQGTSRPTRASAADRGPPHQSGSKRRPGPFCQDSPQGCPIPRSSPLSARPPIRPTSCANCSPPVSWRGPLRSTRGGSLGPANRAECRRACALTEKDLADLHFGLTAGVDMIAPAKGRTGSLRGASASGAARHHQSYETASRRAGVARL